MVAGAIRDDRELSLAKLARRLGVSRSRAGQLLSAAAGPKSTPAGDTGGDQPTQEG